MNDETKFKVVDSDDEQRCLVVKAEVKRIIKELDHQTASDFADALSRHVEHVVRAAVKRAAANGRKQVRGYDL